MQQESYLRGYIYHMTHFDNLRSIFKQGALLSKDMLTKRNLGERSIAYDSVQGLRDRIFIKDIVQQHYRRLHCYVPFYFARYPPMSYVQYNKGILNDIVFFVVERSILSDQGVLFTDGNASMQQLSRGGGERVGIVPATRSELCSRHYKPGGPYGTGSSASNFYSDVVFLQDFDWFAINGASRENKQIRSAEVLVPDKFPISRIHHIAVCTLKIAVDVNTIAKECGLAGLTSFIIVDPSFFTLP